jgi:ERCC4-type nuclease
MNVDMSSIVIPVTKPKGKIAQLLAAEGINLVPIEEDEGNADRYILSKRVAVERRTSSSFVTGIMEKTLFTGAIYLREHFKIPILIVEGQVNYEYSMMNPQAVRGALSSMMLLYQVNVVSTTTPEETAQLIAMMARQEQTGIPDISLVPKRKATSIPDQQRRIIEMLPGCGMVKARELLDHFGSVQRVVNATETQFKSLRGIGAKKAREMARVLTAEYEAVDTERQLEDAIAVNPKLLFGQKHELVARQHYIFSEGKERHIVDMVFYDKKTKTLFLVELKRGKLGPTHQEQLGQYLDQANKSPLVVKYLDQGAQLKGLLATVEPCTYKPRRKDISTRIVDSKKVIRLLKKFRKTRLKTSQ